MAILKLVNANGEYITLRDPKMYEMEQTGGFNLNVIIVEELPNINDAIANTIYFVPVENNENDDEPQLYKEYLCWESIEKDSDGNIIKKEKSFELLGDTKVSLDGYVTEDFLSDTLDGYVTNNDKAELEKSIEGIYAKQTDLQPYAKIEDVKKTYAKIEDVQNTYATQDNLNNYYTKEQIQELKYIDETELKDKNYVTTASLLDEEIKLKNDLYTYVNIGKVTGASNTSPKLVAEKGKSLKDVFNKVFGTQEDVQPTITTSGVSLSVNAGTTSYGGGEFGTAVAKTDVTITFTLNNSATAQYGYRCGSTKTPTADAPFKYAITKQTNDADIKITLPSGQTATSSMVTAGTFKGADSNILYCNFNSSNKVSIKIHLAAGSVTASSQTRYGQIKGEVSLGAAQNTSGTTIDKFLTYLGNDATDTAKLSGGAKSGTAGAYTITAGSYYPYYLTSASDVLTSIAKGVAKQFSNSSSAVEVELTSDAYVWFLLPPNTSGNKTIQYEALGNWYEFNGGTAGPFDIELTLNSSTEDNTVITTYKGYRTIKQAAAGTTKFKIIDKEK